MYRDETLQQDPDPRCPRQACRQTPLHHRHPPRLLAPAPHPPSLRLRRLRPRRGPPHLRVDRLLSRRPHQADQPPPRAETPCRTLAPQLSQNQSHLGAYLRAQPPTPARREERRPMRSLPLQFTFADLELLFQGVHLDPVLRTISEFLDQHLTLVEQVRQDLDRGLKNARTGRNGIAHSQVL